MTALHNLSLSELRSMLDDGALSSVELTQHYLDRIETLDEQINSFVTVTKEQALSQAKAADERLAAGERSPLLGIPIAHKDIFCTKDVLTTCSSKMLSNFVAPYESTATENLKTAGMVMLGKLNMDEFAMGSSNETSFFGAVSNPWDLTRSPGGSSGGSAAAVAAGLAPVSTGSDTGGSIRQPAAFCGLTGIKPTYGTVSRWGMIAFASSLDQGGVLAQSASDAALVLEQMISFDEKDSTNVAHPEPTFTPALDASISGLRVGVPEAFFTEGLDPAIAKAVRQFIATLEELGATVKPVSLDLNEHAIGCYYVIAPSEASANLSRFDGLRYGHRCDEPIDLADLYERSRSEGFGDEVKNRILVGTYALSAGYYDAYYKKAQQVRRLIRDEYDAAFEEVDVIVTPTTPNTAFKIGEKAGDPEQMYLEDAYTLAINLAGLPALSLPVGESAGLPIGAQIIGAPFAEAKILQVAHQYQLVSNHHKRRAPMCEEEQSA